MKAMNVAAPTELIPVQRRPHLAKKIPIVASIPRNDDAQRVIEKWRGTTPHGRELIRKKLWELKRQLLREDFDTHWSRIESMLPRALFSKALADQDDNTRESIKEHLTRTEQWAAYRDSVERCARAVVEMRWCSPFMERKDAVEFFQRIAADERLGSGGCRQR